MEHRYRAWDRVQKKMSYHVTVYSDGEDWGWYAGHVNPDTDNTICSFDDNAGELMQYTGREDRSGVKIFEDDIVKVYEWLNGKLWEGHIHNAKVIFCDGEFTIDPCWRHQSLRSDVEIIGNKWETPGLLK